VAALVAVYEARIASFAADRERIFVQANTSLRQRLRDFSAEHLRHGPGALIFATFCATAATASFMAYDFHELSPYVLIGNPLTLGIIEFFAIPGALIGAVLYPLGLDGFVWQYGSAPGATVHLKAFAPYALIFLSLAVLSAVIWRTALSRVTAIPLAIIGLYRRRTARCSRRSPERVLERAVAARRCRSARAEGSAERRAMRCLRLRSAIARWSPRRLAAYARGSRRRLRPGGAGHRAVPGAERLRRRDNHRSASSRYDRRRDIENPRRAV
jgi:hypothetical protein